MTPRNPMEAVYGSAKASFVHLGLTACGPLPSTKPDRVLADIAALEKQLTFLKAAARAEIAARKRAAREEAKALAARDPEKEAAMAAEIERRRAEQARIERLSGSLAVEGLVHMAQQQRSIAA